MKGILSNIRRNSQLLGVFLYVAFYIIAFFIIYIITSTKSHLPDKLDMYILYYGYPLIGLSDLLLSTIMPQYIYIHVMWLPVCIIMGALSGTTLEGWYYQRSPNIVVTALLLMLIIWSAYIYVIWHRLDLTATLNYICIIAISVWGLIMLKLTRCKCREWAIILTIPISVSIFTTIALTINKYVTIFE